MKNSVRIGLIGLSTMGANLARNFASKGIEVSVFNRTSEKTQNLLDEGHQGIFGYFSISEFLASLGNPRMIYLLVKSGSAVDEVIAELLPLVDKEDIIIDMGNSLWTDTQQRQEFLSDKVHFVGCGISGGWEGALNGPSIMPGGSKEAIDTILPYLREISAKDFEGDPCTAYVGSGYSGHLVKMAHNGIEYALMQAIAEIYDICRSEGYDNSVIQDIFRHLNMGLVQGYLMDITVDILGTKDIATDSFLVDLISDRAENKGTGAWTVQSASQYGVSVPSISAALNVRYQSSRKYTFIDTFEYVHPSLPPKLENTYKSDIIVQFKYALELAFLAAYLQGLEVISRISLSNNLNIHLSEIIRIWQGGCIIRSRYLSEMFIFWDEDKDKKEKILYEVKQNLSHLYKLFSKSKIPLPVLHSTYDYFSTIFRDSLPTNLIQAQRDYFGAHGYERVDLEGIYTGGWK